MAAASPGVNLSEQWVLDSGCTNHITGRKDLFVTSRPANRSPVTGINDSLKAESIGIIQLKCVVKGKLKVVQFDDVLYVPGIICNLMSESQLMKKGASCVKTQKGAEIVNGALKLTADYNPCGL